MGEKGRCGYKGVVQRSLVMLVVIYLDGGGYTKLHM